MMFQRAFQNLLILRQHLPDGAAAVRERKLDLLPASDPAIPNEPKMSFISNQTASESLDGPPPTQKA